MGVAQGGKVVYPPSGYGPGGMGGPGGTGFYNVNMDTGAKEEVEVVICRNPKCKARIKLKPDLKFCPECGKKIFDDE
jgi:ssDNA-binding Zn-finger/Zn-ribbon topoisomerase 1